MMKHIAIPQILLNEQSRLDIRGKDEMSDEERRAHEALVSANNEELLKYGDQPMTEEEIAERQAEEKSYTDEQPRLNILAEIAKIEALQTPRRLRAAALGRDAGYLSDLENQIEKLRNQL